MIFWIGGSIPKWVLFLIFEPFVQMVEIVHRGRIGSPNWVAFGSPNCWMRLLWFISLAAD